MRRCRASCPGCHASTSAQRWSVSRSWRFKWRRKTSPASLAPAPNARAISVCSRSGYSISGSIGPLLAGITIDSIGYRAAFAAMAVVPLVSAAVLASGRPSLPHSPQAAGAIRHGGVRALWQNNTLRRVFLINALLAMSWDLHTVFVPIYGERIGLSASQIGVILASFGAATFVVRLLMPVIVRYRNEHQVLTGTLFLAGAVYAVFPFSQSLFMLATLLVLPGACAWQRSARRHVAVAYPCAAGANGGSCRASHVARAIDVGGGAAPVRRAWLVARRRARILVGRQRARSRRVPIAPRGRIATLSARRDRQSPAAGRRDAGRQCKACAITADRGRHCRLRRQRWRLVRSGGALRLRRSANSFLNFATLGATTTWQYGWPALRAKYSWW